MPEETGESISRANAIQRAMQWLMATEGQAVRYALENEFFGSLDPEDYEQLKDQCRDLFDATMVNATEWLLADGFFFAKGQGRRVSELLLARGGGGAGKKYVLARLLASRTPPGYCPGKGGITTSGQIRSVGGKGFAG